jgi:DNA-binding MarR family transcriptional regulator
VTGLHATGLDRLDPVIHAPKRLAAMAILASASTTDFPFLRDYLQISDSDLSKQMAALEKAGYVFIHKNGRGRGAVTSYRITRDGKRAFRRHVDALRTITDG